MKDMKGKINSKKLQGRPDPKKQLTPGHVGRSQSSGQLPVTGPRRNRSMSLTTDLLGFSTAGYRRMSSDGTVLRDVSTRLNGLGVVREKEKNDLKSRLSELEDFKTKYEAERRENEKLEDGLKQLVAGQNDTIKKLNQSLELKLQDRLKQLLSGQNDTTKKLNQSLELVDKLQTDVKKKTEQIEKFQRDSSYKDDRIRNLEIRASEVEKAELILETTKQNLESTNQQVRVRENEIRRLTKEGEDLNRSLELANKTIKEMEARTEDLKIQVRQELMKNDNIEKNLETIPRLKETIEEKNEEIRDLEQQLREKSALLTSSRRTLGEYKDKLRYTESEISLTERLKAELHDCQCEIHTLKKLMSGKDYLVVQKSKALDLSKELIEVLNDSSDHSQMEKVQHLMERLDDGPPTHTRSLPSRNGTLSSASEPVFRSISAPPPKHSPGARRIYAEHTVPLKSGLDVNEHPYPSENGIHGNQDGSHSNQKQAFLNKVIVDSPGNRKRPISALGHTANKKTSVHKTSSLREAQKIYKHPLPRKNTGSSFEETIDLKKDKGHAYKSDVKVNSKLKPSLEYTIGLDDNHNDSHLDHSLMSPRVPTPGGGAYRLRSHSISDSDSDLSDFSDDDLLIEQESAIRSLSGKEKDALLSDIVSVGDRVLISCAQKQPKYGKKREVGFRRTVSESHVSVLKPINHTGIVKFRGKLDPNKYDARIYVGVRMDDTTGDTDGTYKGKRFMYTPYDQGKFFKLRDVTSVLDVKTGRYVLVKKLMLRILQKRKITLPASEDKQISQ